MDQRFDVFWAASSQPTEAREWPNPFTARVKKLVSSSAATSMPRRLTAVEQLVAGQPKTADTAALAGRSAVNGATPRNFNHFKIPLLQNLVTRAIRDA